MFHAITVTDMWSVKSPQQISFFFRAKSNKPVFVGFIKQIDNIIIEVAKETVFGCIIN